MSKFFVDCKQPVEDNVIEVAALEKYFQDRIKASGRMCTSLEMIFGRSKSPHVGGLQAEEMHRSGRRSNQTHSRLHCEVNGKTGNFGDALKVSKEKQKAPRRGC